jgi:hypothetical protein
MGTSRNQPAASVVPIAAMVMVGCRSMRSAPKPAVTRRGLRTRDGQPGARLFEFPNVFECSRKKMRDKSAKSLLRGLLS